MGADASEAASERQFRLSAREDWRFHAIAPGGTGLVMIATTEKSPKLSRRLVSFALPSAPALYLNLAHDAHRRRSAIDLDAAFVTHPPPQGTWPDDHSPVFNYFQGFAAEIVFAFTALEAFANEMVPDKFKYSWTNGKKEVLSLTRAEIERLVSLDEKLKSVLPSAHGLESPAGTKPWEHFKKLKRIRDRLVHLKSIDRRASGPEDQTIWGLMLAEKESNFALRAYEVMGAYPSLVGVRRWYQLAGERLGAAQARPLK